MYIQVENINKSYGKAKVLNDINFNIEKGEIIGLMGLISGLDTATYL